jgi:hypothetical protein
MLVNSFHWFLLDHLGEFRAGEHCEAYMIRNANRLLYVGHAMDMGSVGDDTVSDPAVHDHAAGYVMDDLHIVRDGEYPSIRVRAICENVPSVLTQSFEDA